MPASTSKILVGRLLLLLAATLVGLLLAEGMVRLAGVAGPPASDSRYDRSVLVATPEPERAHPWVPPGNDPFRLAVIGDSFAAGVSNLQQSAFPAQLERLLNLNADARPVEVLRLARAGTNTQDQRGFLYKSRELGADMILLAVFLNDTEMIGDPELAAWRERIQPRRRVGDANRWLRRSHLATWLYQRYEMARAKREQEAYMHYLFDPEYRGWLRFVNSIEHFREKCAEWEIELAVVIFPPMAALDPEVYPYRFAHERIRAVLRERDIVHFDLLQTFLGKAPQRMAAYPAIDAHPSEIGPPQSCPTVTTGPSMPRTSVSRLRSSIRSASRLDTPVRSE